MSNSEVRSDAARAEEQYGGTIIDLGVRWGDGELSDAEFVNRIIALLATPRDARLAAIAVEMQMAEGFWNNDPQLVERVHKWRLGILAALGADEEGK